MNTLYDINQQAQRVLRTALGPVDYVRYQQQFSHGTGDYTAERQQGMLEDIEAIVRRVNLLKAEGLLSPPPKAEVLD
jgi:hypothetical protein